MHNRCSVALPDRSNHTSKAACFTSGTGTDTDTGTQCTGQKADPDPDPDPDSESRSLAQTTGETAHPAMWQPGQHSADSANVPNSYQGSAVLQSPKPLHVHSLSHIAHKAPHVTHCTHVYSLSHIAHYTCQARSAVYQAPPAVGTATSGPNLGGWATPSGTPHRVQCSCSELATTLKAMCSLRN